jgi:hypothetical protein
MVAHTCNPTYSGGRDQEDLCMRPAQAKSQPAHISINKLMVGACNPSYEGSINKRIEVQANRKKLETLLEK